MVTKTFLQTFFATVGVTSVLLTTYAFAQSQSSDTVNQTPDSVYTYHGAMIAPPPQSELVPMSSMTSSETIVQTRITTPDIAYPDSDIHEPMAVESDRVASHEASLVTQTKAYDRNGKLVSASQIDHVTGQRQ